MSVPKHQHFIPRSYLENFAISKDNKFFVEAKRKDEEAPKSKLLSIKDICVGTNLYTFPHVDGNDKYILEKFYAENIDGVYPEVYRLLTNPDRTDITIKERAQIVITTMSLFFRTPKFLNLNERRINVILDYALKNHLDNNGNVRFKFKDYDFNFHIDNIEEVRTNLKKDNKQKFLRDHFEDWQKFVQVKVDAGLSVIRFKDNVDLITSDNPVTMYNLVSNQFNVFDPNNMISLPLDNKHLLTIFPNSDSSMLHKVFRGERDKRFGLVSNLEVDKNSEEWIIGKPGSIKAHIKDQIKYGEFSIENIQAFEDLQEMAYDWKLLINLMDQAGTYANQKVANKVKELRKKPIHMESHDMKELIFNLEQKGFITE